MEVDVKLVEKLIVHPGAVVFWVNGMQYEGVVKHTYAAGDTPCYDLQITRIPPVRACWIVGENVNISLKMTTAHDAGEGSL